METRSPQFILVKENWQTISAPSSTTKYDRDKHSTETDLVKVQNDLLPALDAGSSAILLMLDLSGAFYTIDHDILQSHYAMFTV